MTVFDVLDWFGLSDFLTLPRFVVGWLPWWVWPVAGIAALVVAGTIRALVRFAVIGGAALVLGFVLMSAWLDANPEAATGRAPVDTVGGVR